MSGRIRADDGGGPGDPPEIQEPVEQPEPAPTPPPNDNPPPEPEGEPEPEAAAGEREQREHKERFDRLTREKYEAIRQRDEYAQMLRQLAAQAQNANQPQYDNNNGGQWQQPQGDPRELGRQQGFREAQEAEIAKRFNADCDALFHRGQQEFGDMSDAVAALNAVGYGQRPDVLAAITKLPDGHRVYRELAGNLDNAARLLQADPVTLARELAVMSTAAPPANGTQATALRGTPSTNAPPPLRPVGGNATRREMDINDPRLSMAEYIRRRDREERRSRISR